MKNRDLWAKVVSRGEGNKIDRAKTIADLDLFLASLEKDQEVILSKLDQVFKAHAGMQYFTTPILCSLVCQAAAPSNPAEWGMLTERATEVIKANCTIEKGQGKGVLNPRYVAPAKTA
jgi:hypothetical protein